MYLQVISQDTSSPVKRNGFEPPVDEVIYLENSRSGKIVCLKLAV